MQPKTWTEIRIAIAQGEGISLGWGLCENDFCGVNGPKIDAIKKKVEYWKTLLPCSECKGTGYVEAFGSTVFHCQSCCGSGMAEGGGK